MRNFSFERGALRSLALVSAGYGGAALGCAGLMGILLIRNPHAEAGNFFPHLSEMLVRAHPGLLENLLRQAGELHLSTILFFLVLYAVLRAIEFFGLWKCYAWGEWFCALSCCVYIPFEAESMFHKITWMNTGALFLNIGLAGYLVWDLLRKRRKKV